MASRGTVFAAGAGGGEPGDAARVVGVALGELLDTTTVLDPAAELLTDVDDETEDAVDVDADVGVEVGVDVGVEAGVAATDDGATDPCEAPSASSPASQVCGLRLQAA